MTPGNLEPETIKLLESLKRMKIIFFEHRKDAHRDFEKGALNDSSRSLIWSFLGANGVFEKLRKSFKCMKM